MEFLSQVFSVRFDPTSRCLLIVHPDKTTFPDPLVTIRHETYSGMSFQEMSAFLGSRLLLLIPEMRDHFKTELDHLGASDTGQGFKGQ